MNKRISILFIFMLFFQVVSSGFLPLQAKAEGLEKGIFIKVTLTDEDGNEIDEENESETSVEINVDWSVSGLGVEPGHAESFTLPTDWQIENDQEDSIMTEEVEVGLYEANTDGTVSVTFSDDIDSHKDASGTFTVEATIEGSKSTEKTDQEVDEPEAKEEKAEKVQEDEEKATIKEDDEETEAVQEDEEEQQVTSASKDSKAAVMNAEVAENLITNVELTLADGGELPNPMPHPSEERLDLEVNYEFSLPDGHDYGAGSTFTFHLPEQFKVHNEVTNDLLNAQGVKFGASTLEADGTITITFTEEIENNSDISGNLSFWTEIKEDLEGSTEQTITFPIEGDATVEFPVQFEPKKGSSIDKRGTPDKNYNAETITWEVDFNKQLADIENAKLLDPIRDNQAFIDGSIKVYELDVQLDGSVIPGEEISSHSYGDEFPLDFGDINSAYRVVFETEITDEDGTYYPNEATLIGDGTDDLSASSTVTVGRGLPLEKKTGEYDPDTMLMTWEVKYNYNEKTIARDQAFLTDTLGEGHAFEEGSIEIVEVDIRDDGSEGDSRPYTNFDVATHDDGFTLQFDEEIDKAYKITYQTKIDDRIIEDSNFKNVVTDGNDNEKGSDKTIGQGVFHKHHGGETDYDAKTTTWNISINDDKHEMKNLVLTDTLPQGLILDEYTITHGGDALEEDTDYTYTYNQETGEITFDFTDKLDPVTDKIDINYTTLFDVNKIEEESYTFTNEAKIEWIPEGSDDKEEKEGKDTFTPNDYTQHNGSKGGSYNATTKEITWDVGVNYNNRTIDQAIIEDIIQGDQNFDIDSIEVYAMKVDQNGNWEKTGDALTVGDDYQVEAIQGKDDEPGFRVSLGEIDSPYVITYQTDLLDQLIVKEYKNTATLLDGQTELTDLDATVSVGENGGKYTDKAAAQSSDNERVLNWDVSINPTQSTISDAVLSDTPSSNQVILKDTFKLYEADVAENGTITINKDKELIVDEDYTLLFKDDEDGNEYFELAFNEEITTAYVLEYETYLMAGNGETVTNNASLKGEELSDEVTETEHSHQVRYSGGSGNIDGRIGQLDLLKIDATTGDPLAEAEFTLYDQTGEMVIETLTTGDDGKIIFENLLFGDYILMETKTPDGYVNVIDSEGQNVTIDQEVSEGEDPNAVTIENDKIIRDVELSKIDGETSDALEKAIFELQDADGEVIREGLETDKSGNILVTELDPGTYYFEETEAPDGYQLGSERIEFTIDAEQTKVLQLDPIENNIILGSVELKKEDDVDGTALEGAEFTLQDADGKLVEQNLTTDADGKLTVGDLRPGDYEFVETQAPTDYVLDSSPIAFTIDPSETEDDPFFKTVTAENTLMSGSVQLNKQDKDNGDSPLAGAEFELRDLEGNIIQSGLASNADGEISVDDLRPGDYQFIETKAPFGYDLDDTPIEFTIDKGQTEVTSTTATNELTTGSVILTKIDYDQEEVTLEGAVFELQDEEGQTLQEGLETDESGELLVEDLKPGNYQFVETTAPFGYELDETPIPFTIVKGQTDLAIVQKVNELTTGSVELTKVDHDDETMKLADAEFELRDANDEVIQEGLITDELGQFVVTDLKPGDYQFVETAAPEHYQLDPTPIEFTIAKGQDISIQVTAGNKLITGSVELIKIDADNSELTLADATFALQDADGNMLEEDFKTDEAGKIIVHDLKPGTYQFVETAAPFGYDLDETPIEFTIERSQPEILSIEKVNELTTGSVELTKVDQDDETMKLAEAEFELRDANDEVIQEGLTTDKSGQFVVTDLKPGDYQFVETAAPKGYELNEAPNQFTIEKGQEESTEVVVENVKQPVKTPDDESADKPSDKSDDKSSGKSDHKASDEDSEKGVTGKDDPGSNLPKTATNLYTIILVGMALLITGITVRFFRKKSDHAA